MVLVIVECLRVCQSPFTPLVTDYCPVVRGMAKHMASDSGQMRLIFLFAYTLNPGDKNTACYKGPHQSCTWEQSKQEGANFVVSRESGTSGSHARIRLVCLNNSMVRQRS